MRIRALLNWRPGQRNRFDRLVDDHHQALFNYAIWLCQDRSRAEDLVQDVFVRAWQHMDQLQHPSAARSWLITILRREQLRWASCQRHGHAETGYQDEHAAPYDADHELQRHQLYRTMLALEPAYMEPLLLQILGGYSIDEIARELALSESAVHTRLYRARQQLIQQMGTTVPPPITRTQQVG